MSEIRFENPLLRSIDDFKILVAGPDQRRLLKYLLDENRHDPLERPVLNESDTLPVAMSLAIQQIIDFVRRLLLYELFNERYRFHF